MTNRTPGYRHRCGRLRKGYTAVLEFVLLSLMAATASNGYSQPPDTGWKPNDNVEIIVGRQAGGALDRFVRLVQNISREHALIDVPVVVINKPGGRGAIAWAYLNQHMGDGRYLMINSTELVTDRITGLSAISFTEVTPIAQLFNEYIVLAVKAESPLKSATDIFERLRTNPGALTASSGSALGSTNYLAIALAAKAAGVDPRKLRLVTFGSAAQAVTALLGGHVDVISVSASNALPQMQARKLRVLAVASRRRMEGPLAHVPTYVEQGLESIVVNWRVITGPPKLTAAQVSYWETVFSNVVQTAEWNQEIRKTLGSSNYKNSKETLEYLRIEEERFRPIFSELGLARKQ